jgi:hypothetical protein
MFLWHRNEPEKIRPGVDMIGNLPLGIKLPSLQNIIMDQIAERFDLNLKNPRHFRIALKLYQDARNVVRHDLSMPCIDRWGPHMGHDRIIIHRKKMLYNIVGKMETLAIEAQKGMNAEMEDEDYWYESLTNQHSSIKLFTKMAERWREARSF